MADVYTLNGQRLLVGQSFEANGLAYAPNFLNLATAEDLAAHGITKTTEADPTPPVTIDQVAAERERRLALGFNYNFGDNRGTHHMGMTKADMEGWGEVSTFAGALIDSGDMTTHITIATNTGICQVTAPEWRAVELAAAAFRQPLWAKSFALMAMNPIPADYTNDSYWS